MKKIFVTVKETLQYVGIIVIALLSGLFLVIKMAVTDVKEETKDIERASKM
jgi:flagellar biosynthesis protein FliQ